MKKVTKQMFDGGTRKYIEIDGTSYKVPFHYKKVKLGLVENITPIQSFQVGTVVDISFYEKEGVKVLTRIKAKDLL